MAEITPELLCIGNPLVDVFAAGDEELALRYGLDKETQHIPAETLKEIIPQLSKPVFRSGGGSANAAKIAGLLGINTGFAGAAGRDDSAALFENELKAAGVATHLLLKETPTGLCLALRMPNGRIKIAAAPSAALELSADDITEDMIRSTKIVLLDGFMLGREELTRRVLATASRYGTVAAIDLSAAGLASSRAHEIVTYARLYPLIIFMNEDEAAAFYRAVSQSRDESPAVNENGELREELRNLFRDFTSHDIFPIIAVKLGKRGSVVFGGGNVFREGTIPVNPVDTIGAGDAFCAAFLASWLHDKSLSKCAAFGNRAAKEVLNINNARPGTKGLIRLGRQIRK